MYTVAALVVERVSGVPYIEFVTENVIKPLGLTSTTYNMTTALASGNVADGYALVNTSDPNIGRGWAEAVQLPIPFWLTQEDLPHWAGPGGVISSANDMATWLKFLLLEGRNPTSNQTIVPSAAILEAANGIVVLDGRSNDPGVSVEVYGLGQSTYSYRGAEVGHPVRISQPVYSTHITSSEAH